MKSRLSQLQRDALYAVRQLSPRFTLTGGAALAGYHLGHRTTRDLDLFVHGIDTLGELPRDVAALLRSHGLTAESVQTTPTYHQFRVSSQTDTVVVDLVAEPVSQLVEPEERPPGILVDRPSEILVNKLCSLLGRTEIRDLEDVRALVEAGEDLERALRLAPQKDGGFSPPMLAWLLDRLPVAKLSATEGFDPGALDRFRRELVARLVEEPSA